MYAAVFAEALRRNLGHHQKQRQCYAADDL